MRHLFATRAEVLRLSQTRDKGVPQMAWQKVTALVDPFGSVPGELRCRIDLSFMRPGKDQPRPEVAGRAPDRVGVMFLSATREVVSGDRIRCLDGPTQGTFEIRAMPDTANDFSQAHHMEVQVIEVAQNMQPNLLNRTRETAP